MVHKKHWPLWAAALAVVGAGGWWAVHTGSPPVHAAIVQRRSRAVAHTTALGVPATPAPVTCCGGTIAGGTPPAASATSSPHPAYQVLSVRGQTVSWPRPGAATVLYFMSAQCGSCIQGERQLAALQAGLPATVQLVSLDVTPEVDTAAMLRSVAREAGADWPQAFATPALLTAYHVVALDQVAVLTDRGRVVYDGGLPSNGQLRQAIARAEA